MAAAEEERRNAARDRRWHHGDPAQAERLHDLDGRVFTRGRRGAP
ncbi:hypothetical protein AB0C76_37235 [Kitasatospora sp. NPDC048722]